MKINHFFSDVKSKLMEKSARLCQREEINQ